MLKKDILELCLLHLLAGRDRYGYEILGLLYNHFPSTQESAIYALLRNLCRGGFLQTYTGDSSGGPARKYYRITEDGQTKYHVLLEQWNVLQQTMEQLGIG